VWLSRVRLQHMYCFSKQESLLVLCSFFSP
jgi:hypothetical protein